MLKPRIDILLSEYEKLKEYEKENQRLNNVLNEFEKWLNEGLEELPYINGDMYWREACELALDKLKELKESD